MTTDERTSIIKIEEGKITLLEPIENIKVILAWIKDTPDAYANISYNPEIGWHICTFINKEESDNAQ